MWHLLKQAYCFEDRLWHALGSKTRMINDCQPNKKYLFLKCYAICAVALNYILRSGWKLMIIINYSRTLKIQRVIH